MPVSVTPKTTAIILFIDHEVQNVITFRAIFRRGYKIISASSVSEAMAILEKERVGIIICSKYIGSMTGVDFLASTISNYPYCSRLLVSDYGNQDPENKAQLLGYLIKP